MRRISFILGLLPLLVFVGVASAQSPQPGQPYVITFPIAELGNCGSVTACRDYCEQPTNHTQCIDFAKKKGFYKQEALESAKTELRCDSLESCRELCEKAQNRDKCAEFAQKHQVSGGYGTNQSEEEILKLARTELGCQSYDACMVYCEQDGNMDRCIDFASRHNLSGNAAQMKEQLSTMKRLLGCNSIRSCMEFCNNPTNTSKCREVFQQTGFATGGDQYLNEPPEVWCSKNSECKWDGQSCTCSGPQSCQQAPGCSWNGQYCNCGGQYSTSESGEVWCPKNPGCTWTGRECNCTNQDSDQYCRDHPDKCASSQEGPPPGTDPTGWCNQNPGKCTYQSGDAGAECTKYGCTYDGKTCQCPQSEEKTDFSSQCLSQPGCSWDAATMICSCATGDQPSDVQEDVRKQCEAAAPGCYWDGIDCRCPQASPAQVQGVTTIRSLLFTLLDFLFN